VKLPKRGLLVLALIVAMAVSAAPRTVLDKRTGATVVVSNKPWLLALDQPHLAANARDYIALYAVEVNIAGKRRHHLAVFFWSTISGRNSLGASQPAIELRVDDRLVKLEAFAATPRDIGISQWPLNAPGRGAVLVVYEVDATLLRQLGQAQQVSLRPAGKSEPVDPWYEPWQDGRRAFAEFAQQALN
jgi:hypothetical protein